MKTDNDILLEDITNELITNSFYKLLELEDLSKITKNIAPKNDEELI